MHWRPDDEPPGNDVGRNLACSLAASDEGPPDVNPNFDIFAEVEDYPTPCARAYAPRKQFIRGTHSISKTKYLRCATLTQLGGTFYNLR
jgi:hypothetical protein